MMSATHTCPSRSARVTTRPNWLVSAKSETLPSIGSAFLFAANRETAYAPKRATMTSASPPHTISSSERVGLFMEFRRFCNRALAPRTVGRDSVEPLILQRQLGLDRVSPHPVHA